MKAKLERVAWTLTAPYRAMQAAEAAVLGGYENHISQAVYPMDDDDDGPRVPTEAEVVIYATDEASRARFPTFFALAGVLGGDATVTVRVDADLGRVSVGTGAPAHDTMTVRPEQVSAELHERVRAASRILTHGVPPKEASS